MGPPPGGGDPSPRGWGIKPIYRILSPVASSCYVVFCLYSFLDGLCLIHLCCIILNMIVAQTCYH